MDSNLRSPFSLSRSIKYLNMNGNPIGEEGGRFLMQSLNYFSGNRDISLSACVLDCADRPDRVHIDMFHPTGHYVFDLTKPVYRLT